MGQYDTICALLKEKREALAEFERHSEEMLRCDSAKLEEHVEARQRIIGRVGEIDRRIEERCVQAKEGETPLREALLNRGQRDALSDGLGRVYDEAQLNFAILNRLRSIDRQVLARMAAEREGLLRSIKEHNRGSDAQAAKFLSPEQPGGERGRILGSRKA